MLKFLANVAKILAKFGLFLTNCNWILTKVILIFYSLLTE